MPWPWSTDAAAGGEGGCRPACHAAACRRLGAQLRDDAPPAPCRTPATWVRCSAPRSRWGGRRRCCCRAAATPSTTRWAAAGEGWGHGALRAVDERGACSHLGRTRKEMRALGPCSAAWCPCRSKRGRACFGPTRRLLSAALAPSPPAKGRRRSRPRGGRPSACRWRSSRWRSGSACWPRKAWCPLLPSQTALRAAPAPAGDQQAQPRQAAAVQQQQQRRRGPRLAGSSMCSRGSLGSPLYSSNLALWAAWARCRHGWRRCGCACAWAPRGRACRRRYGSAAALSASPSRGRWRA